MLTFIQNEQIPKSYTQMKQFNQAGDYAIIETTSPINIFILLNNIAPLEQNFILEGKFSIGVTIIEDVLFLTLSFVDHALTFDMAIEVFEDLNPKNNALNIILVEKQGFIFQGARTIGLEQKIFAKIEDFLINRVSISHDDYVKKVKILQNKYTTVDLIEKNIIKQDFNWTK